MTNIAGHYLLVFGVIKTNSGNGLQATTGSLRHRALAINKGEEDWSYHQTSCEHEDTDVFLELIHQ